MAKTSNYWTPTAEQLVWITSAFSIDPETGRITRLSTDRPADGQLTAHGYRKVTLTNAPKGLSRKVVLAHRIAWVLYHGEPARADLDHVNGDRQDNAKSNLRLALGRINACNPRKGASYGGRPCHSQWKGVSKTKGGKWFAQLGLNGTVVKLGTFDSEREAALAYNRAVMQRDGEYALINNVQAFEEAS